MTTLEFNKTGDVYVASFQLSKVTMIHIERSTKDEIRMYQNAADEGSYDEVEDWKKYMNQNVIDTTISNETYPLYIRLVCKKQPTVAYIV